MAETMPGPINGRNDHVQQTSFLRLNLSAADNLVKLVGRLPEKAVILRATVVTGTAFDAGNITLGTADAPGLLGAALSLKAAGRATLTVPTTVTWNTDEIDIVATRDAAATAGEAVVIIEFIQNR